MKLNVVLTLISITLAGLAAFGFYTANENDTYRLLITIGSGITLLVTLGGLLALSSDNRGTIMNIRVVSGLFFLIFLIEHIVFSFTGVKYTLYIIITGSLMALYVLICYMTIRALKKV